MEARPNALFDPAWLGRVVSEKQAELLCRYRAVLFAEVDEIVIPREGSLRQSVAAFARETERGAEAAEAAEVEAEAEAEAEAEEEAEASQTALPPAVACTGWEMHHDFGSEPAIDLTRPLLAQRSRWHRNTLYDKVRYGYAYYGYSLPRP